MSIAVRAAQPSDLPAIHAIQEHYVLNTPMNFSYEPASLFEMRATYDDVLAEGYQYVVAVPAAADATRPVLGYAYVHSFRARAAYQYTGELSIFCHPQHTGGGAGSLLLAAIVEGLREARRNGACEHAGDGEAEHQPAPDEEGLAPRGSQGDVPPPCRRDVHTLLACMTVDPDPVQAERLRRFYARRGFVETACLKKVGWKGGRWLDTRYMQLEV